MPCVQFCKHSHNADLTSSTVLATETSYFMSNREILETSTSLPFLDNQISYFAGNIEDLSFYRKPFEF